MIPSCCVPMEVSAYVVSQPSSEAGLCARDGAAGDNGSTSLDRELLRPPPHPQPSVAPRPGPGGVTTFLPLGWAGQAPGPTHPDLVPLTHLQRKLSTHTILPQGSH